ncbi:dipeptide ABC transporter ATP-binding protein [Rhizobium miluonense]|uniref:Glutathione import ATP-binding protein GsiA n=1 Tax=Rhizobium miluonense TaxID=411945 RepID=A0A1C3UBM4_9HYPH|nr:ABC transporter ATP-binding protein [Rhizobium miluonense]SCB12892.1 peptide/nickel transport system ATP-binding protein [Rhizobium miluonense]
MLMKTATPVIEVQDLAIPLPGGGDRGFAVDHISLSVAPGEIVCVVGESGSGKSVTAQSIMGLLPKVFPKPAGRILFEGKNITEATPAEMRDLRGRGIGMIFQETMTALNPVQAVGKQIDEVLRTHLSLSRKERFDKVIAAMAEVRLPDPETLYHAFPHQLSGGQRQRVLIAAALILQPKLLIADEPTTALDVTTQAQILSQVRELQRERGMGVLFITHDIGVVREIADRVVVMKAGKMIEQGTADQVLNAPASDYTRMLIASVPTLEPKRSGHVVTGTVALEMTAVTKTYHSGGLFRDHRTVQALREASLSVRHGETLGIIGESGSGKSTLARCVMQLIEPSSGSIELPDATDGRTLRQRMQMVFQDPYRSLNPRRTVGQSIIEGPMNFGQSKSEALERARELMQLVGLEPHAVDRFPHQFSGGQRQRISIARALAMEPDILVADEAVSALDVSVQAQVLRLIDDIQKRFDLAILFITHDLRVAAEICDRLIVMHRGEIVEQGAVSTVFTAPAHRYTRELLASIPGRAEQKVPA